MYNLDRYNDKMMDSAREQEGLLHTYTVVRNFLNIKSKEFNIPVDELYLQIYRDNEILLLKNEDYGKGIEVLQEIEI